MSSDPLFELREFENKYFKVLQFAPLFVEYCTNTPSFVVPLNKTSGASHGDGSELYFACLYSKLKVPPLDTSIARLSKDLGNAKFCIHKY